MQIAVVSLVNLNIQTNQRICGGVSVLPSCFNSVCWISVRILVKRGASESIDADRVLVGESDRAL